jgi:[NiFe] hydrogenase diaphorase moiety small subunit
MSNIIKFTIDGKECMAQKDQYIVDAARENDVYIPTLCNIPGIKPQGSCRICTVKVRGRLMTSCTTPVQDGMEIESNTKEIESMRKMIVEMMFVSGNHFCPACEKSGSCELQALAYRYQMMVPRFPYSFPLKEVDGSSPLIIKDQNRCILCKRCIRGLKDNLGRSFFTFKNRGNKLTVVLDEEMGSEMTEAIAEEAMACCPVGAILKKEKGFEVPIGNRKYDKEPIGNEIEN